MSRIKELERAARLGLADAMITEYPLDHRRYDGSEYEPVLGRRHRTWPAAEPTHGHAAAGQDPRGRRQDIARRQQPRDQGVLSGLSMCDLILSGVFERHSRLTLAIVEFELAWALHLLSTMDYTYRERHGEAIYRFKSLPSRRLAKAGDGMLPSDFFRRKVVLSFQEDAIGIT